ncbi:amino acid adenylation domain-containing protein/non-ribosomal peptide synthase protein (TIGR01720 family) [Paenibacillus sp. DS2015]|uniref:amino acid adenylation domain-containing protein n=1 Tax=Paenibacillus sp. DS2015 TaxID=3373917 RepID=UPI003D20F976
MYTLSALLQDRSHSSKGILFISGRDKEQFVSYEALFDNSMKLLKRLQDAGIEPGEEAVFQIEDNRSFITVFWACLLGGIIPVPISVGEYDEHKLKFVKVWGKLRQPCLITTQQRWDLLQKYASTEMKAGSFQQMKARTILLDDTLADNEYGTLCPAHADQVAFIQFSSGSTGEPKGVVLTHANVITNIKAIIRCSQIDDRDSILSWMPLTHDMGLIGNHLVPLVADIQQLLMPTSLFITRPLVWFDKASEHQATLLSSPNFGYHYILQHLKEHNLTHWNLSSVRLIFNGAEPISAELIEKFIDQMEHYGLRRDSMYPVYGLAEAGLAVTFPPIHETIATVHIDRKQMLVGQQIQEMQKQAYPEVATFVDVGYAIEPDSLRICYENGQVMDELHIGYIQIKGNNVTSCYYNDAEATLNAINSEGWLNTGDLGFMRNGRLIVTGRAKDIIFMNGINVYPHDIERMAAQVAGMELGKLAACGVYNKDTMTEDVLLFIVWRKKLDELVPRSSQLKSMINRGLGIELKEVIPVRSIPKTTSGKPQRYALRDRYENREFEDIISTLQQLSVEQLHNIKLEPANEIEAELVQIWNCALSKDARSMEDHFFEHGGNSLKAALLVSEVQSRLHVQLLLKHVYEYPTISSMASYISTLEAFHPSVISRAEEQHWYPTLVGQQKIYAHHQIYQDKTYNIVNAFRVKGKINKEKLEASFQKLIKRHDVFRTGFEMRDGQPVQMINDEVSFHIEMMEDGASEPAIIEQFTAIFDLSRPPLLRVGLLDLSDRESMLIIDVHHLIADGVSIPNLMMDWTRIYDQQELAPNELQFKDVAVWQTEQMELIEHHDRSQQFWTRQLVGGHQMLDLPTSYPRTADVDYRGDTVKVPIEPKLVDQLRQLAIQQNTSLYMICLSVFYILLNKYTQQNDVVIGTSLAGRSRSEMEHLIGMFVNTVPLRSSPVGDHTFTQFLQEVKDNFLEAFEYQDHPIEQWMDDWQKSDRHHQLYNTTFVMQNMKTFVPQTHEFELTPLEYHNKTSKFELTLFGYESDAGLDLELEYRTCLFKKDTMRIMLRHYVNLLHEIIAHPTIRISQFQMLSQDERNDILYTTNLTHHDYPKDKTIIQLFEEQVVRTPNNVAIRYENRQVTYEQFNQQVNHIAHVLIRKGAKRNRIIALLMHRSIDMMIVLYGILKSGAAYLPIDPEYPQERIQYMLEDSGAELLISTPELTRAIHFSGEISNVDVVLNDSPEGNQDRGRSNPKPRNDPDDLVYVIYTSGSTGKPKGTMIEHRGLVNYIWWANKMYVQGEQAVFPLYSSIAFDLTVTSIFTPLIAGNQVVIYPGSQKELVIHDVIQQNEVTVLKLTPSHLKLIANMDLRHSNIKRIIVGGEQLDTQWVAEVVRRFDHEVDIYNEYGPTETVVGCMIYRYSAEKDRSAYVPIGKPAHNVKIYILDSALQPVPYHVVGDLYISGDGVARGYLNQPEISADRFIINPFSTTERMYTTGDQAKMLPDGNMVYVGRRDQQVKIRGYRIELGEIESCLSAFPGIQQCIVIDTTDHQGIQSLCAYFVSEEAVLSSDIRSYLLKYLPEYMLPQYFMQVQELSLTANGKIDRAALPAPVPMNVQLQNTQRQAETELEQTMVEVWREVLGVEHIGIEDDFYSMGGDSIKAIQVSSRLQEYGYEVDIRDLLIYQTIGQISDVVHTTTKQNQYEQGLVSGVKQLFPIEEWFFEQQFANPHYYQQSILLQLKQPFDEVLLEQAFEKVVQHHDGLRMNYDPVGHCLFFNESHAFAPFKLLKYDISSLSKELKQESMQQMGAEIKSSFHIETDLLLKAALVKFSGTEQQLFITAHHLVIDGVSWRIILEDVIQIYESLTLRQEPVLKKKTAALSEWYGELSNYAQTFASSFTYWSDEMILTEALPLDFEPEHWLMENVVYEQYDLDPEWSKKLRVSIHKAYNTNILDVLLTALFQTLQQWTEQTSFVIELEGHGRNLHSIDVSRTVGWFTAMYPVKLAAPTHGIAEQIKQIKEKLRGIPHQGLSYGVLKYTGQDKRLASNSNTRAEVRFNYLGQFDHEIENDWFSISDIKTGPDVSLSNSAIATLDVICMFVNNTLRVQFHYNQLAYKEVTMNRLLSTYIENLKTIIKHCCEKDGADFTPSDFETIQMNQEDLDSLFL